MKIVMLKGNYASGKTYWAREQQRQGGNYIIVSQKEIRKMFGGYKSNREKDVLRIRNEIIRTSIKLKKNVIVDDTNLNPKHERYLRQLAKELEVKFEINDSFLEVSPEECIKRDLHRGEKAVGSQVIWKTFYKWITPSPVKKLDKNFEKPRAVLCDLDGTLAFNLNKRNINDLFRVHEDVADPFTSCVLDALYNYGTEINGEKYPRIIIISGREETSREVTVEWLNQYGIPYDEVWMRPKNDKRADDVVKEELYKKYIEPNYAVLGVFDDKNCCVRMWQRLGLRVANMGLWGIDT